MKQVQLHGWLKNRFGASFRMEVRTPAEAIRALCSQLKGFQKEVSEDEIGFHIYLEESPIDKESLHYPFSSRETFHIVPVIAGSKEGLGQILLGVVMIGLAFATMGTSILGQGLLYEAVMTGLTSLGTSLILGGISQLLFTPPKAAAPAEAPGSTPSYSFNGAVNTMQQGNCVPVCYGEVITGSQVVSIGLFTEDFAV